MAQQIEELAAFVATTQWEDVPVQCNITPGSCCLTRSA